MRQTESRFWRHSRREFLKIGGLGFGGLSLPVLQALSTSRASSCIILFQGGGSSQLDTFDPKPDAPSGIRSNFKTISTAVPGTQFTELLPESAKIADKFAVIRSVSAAEAIHERARQHIFSGTRPRNELLQPSFGSVVAKEKGSLNGLPPYVVIPDADQCVEAGFLGPTFDPFLTGDPNGKKFSVRDLTLPTGITFEETGARSRLLASLDSHFKNIEESPLVASMDEFSQKAFDLISSPAAKKAFNLTAEPGKLRDRYGRSVIGQGALLARRLIESGVRLATVFQWGYDTHTEHEPTNKIILPQFDKAFATLILDLEDRGLLDTTLVLVVSDFGRTPKVNFLGGRDHWPRVSSVALAGAGIRGGALIGATDKIASDPIDRPVLVEDLGATIYAALGIDRKKVYMAGDRPVKISAEGEPVNELWN